MLRLLIVDDEPNVREGLRNSIDWKSMGVEIAGTAEDGISASRLVESENPDVVLTDIKMPGKDGLELARWMKESYPSTAVIFLTGYSDFEYVRTALELEAVHYLLKPLEEDELARTLDKIKNKIQAETGRQKKYDEAIGILQTNLPVLKEKFIEDVLNEKISPDKLDSMLEFYNLDLKSLKSKRLSKVVSELLGYVKSNYSSDIDLKTAAAHFYMNPNYLSRIFSTEMSKSFTEYLTDFRMQKARELLKSGNDNIYTISGAVGYGNEKYFSKLFKKREGITPLEYRGRFFKA